MVDYAIYNPAGASRTSKTGRLRNIPKLRNYYNHIWFQEYLDDFISKNILENNGVISGCVISQNLTNQEINCSAGEVYINGFKVTISAPATFPTTGDGWYAAYADNLGVVTYEHWINTDIMAAPTPDNAVLIGFVVQGDGVFYVSDYFNEISDESGISNIGHIQPNITVGVDLVTDPRATNIETDFIASLSPGDKLLFLAGVTLTANRIITGQVEMMADGPDIPIALDTFDLTLNECSGYASFTTVSGTLILNGITHGLIINGSVVVTKGPLFSGSYCLNGVWSSADATIQVLTQPDHIILTSAKQALYANDDKILRVDPDGVTFRRKDNTAVIIADNRDVKIDSTEQLTNNLHFDFNNSSIEVLRQFEIDTNGNKVFFDGNKNRVNVHTTEDYDKGLETAAEEDQRVAKNRGSGNIIRLNGRQIFSGSRPTEIFYPARILDPYVISQNGFSYNGFKLGSPVDECLFTDWWLHWGGLDLVGDGSILIPPIFNPFSGVLQRKVFSSDDAGRFMRFNTPIGGSTGVDPDVHGRTTPSTLATIATYVSSASAEISGITDAAAIGLKLGARVADAGLSIPQGSSGTPKTTIISSIIHNATNNNSIFLIDSETGLAVVVSATGNLTIDMSGNSGISRQLDAMFSHLHYQAFSQAAPTHLGRYGTIAGLASNTDGESNVTQIAASLTTGHKTSTPNDDGTGVPRLSSEGRPISNQRQSYLIL